MRRRKHKRMVGNISIMYISTILALSFIGVGYAAWSGDISMSFSIDTGKLQGSIGDIKKSKINFDDGESISFKYSNENRNLSLVGEVYPTFDEEIPIKIIDEGNVPVKFGNIDLVKAAEISKLKEESKGKFRRATLIEENIITSLGLNISPENNKDSDSGLYKDIKKVKRYSIEEQDNTSGLEEQISNLKRQIDEYDTEEEYDFEYELLLEQDL